MKLRVENGEVSLSSLYKFLVVGWLIGVGSFTVLGTIFALPILYAADAPMVINGEMIAPEDKGARPYYLFPFVAVFAAVFNAVWFSGFMVLGLWLYRKFSGPFTITEISSSANGENRSPSG
ncbi:hypothetical protein HK107_14195 [Parvularcula sp. ZS-1/3]|uniref:Uncharacterized protein n=1 Tax=Parvularcula mediterranea TaxID=2732508 RepID=A0A7Y3W650_9PROT|nr:hypothetical protein [Parvularcula mediterranea]NNU17480.1 hypothetical protein [Parvularcula mediterranea]